MKTNVILNATMLCLCIMVYSACKPAIRTGEKTKVGLEQINKFWTLKGTAVQGDTVILENKDAQVVSKFNSRNFSFTARLLTVDGAEGRLLFHTSPTGANAVKGYSVIINNTDYRKGSTQKTGSLSLIRNNYVRTASDGNWFDLKLEISGNHIAVFVNDKIVSEYIQPDHPSRIEGLENMTLSDGRFIFQKTNDSGEILISDIQMEALDDDLPLMNAGAYENDSLETLTLLNQQGFPVIDYHGHLKGGLTIDQVCQHGRINGYNYGISPNCGLNFPVTNDAALDSNYNALAEEPVFKAMQCEGREWVTLFSPEFIVKYDYIFTDAMTWTDHKGRRLRLWIPGETFVDDEQQFMEMLVSKIEAEMSLEPVDIYVNPTYLPDVLVKDYDRLWTPERMDRVIKALAENDVALEINSRFKIPSVEFVRRAKAAGVKFTFGTNNAGNNDLGRLDYSLKVVKEVGIGPEDMFFPKPAGEKKILSKGLPAKITG
jgi:hypothetical protein